MVLKLHNSLSRELEDFHPIRDDGTVTLYTCGPTVYNYPHIGNYRAYLFGDLLKRVLLYNGYVVNHIMNLTDVDDKTIRDSQLVGKDLRTFTDHFIDGFYEDRDALHILRATTYTRATDYIDEMVALIQTLLEKGYAYKADDGSVYFKIEKFKEYGKLSHLDRTKLANNASGRMRADEYEKDNVQDFALWKAWDKTDGPVFWETALGKGHPGWHIECSAMSMKNLGETIDIHTGGIDNMFPHHENEIAQSECATGKPFVHYWMHNQWLLVDGKKMAKSAGNFYTLRDVKEKGFDPLAFRYLSLLTHYATPLNFTWEALEAAQTALKRLQHRAQELMLEEDGEVSAVYEKLFREALNENVNVPKALGIVFTMLDDKTLSLGTKKATLLTFDSVLGFDLKNQIALEIPEEVQALVGKRQDARKNKDWKLSDSLRGEILEKGYEVNDTDTGSVVSKL